MGQPHLTDLLGECNSERLPPAEFKSLFCQRCRNQSCGNAGWSGSVWTERMSTQVDRLLNHPLIADEADPKFTNVRALRFLEIAPPTVINTRDPWEGPGKGVVHLAEPDPQVATAHAVDAAVHALTGREVRVSPQTQPPVVVVAPPAPLPTAAPQHRANPPVAPVRAINTEWAEEGVMIDGSPVVEAPRPVPQVAVDPWAPVAPPAKVVTAGARIKMGG